MFPKTVIPSGGKNCDHKIINCSLVTWFDTHQVAIELYLFGTSVCTDSVNIKIIPVRWDDKEVV